MARYECTVCGYVYDDDQEELAWDSLPDDWACPACGADKTLFNVRHTAKIRLGLCCILRDEPIKFRTTTAAAVKNKMKLAVE